MNWSAGCTAQLKDESDVRRAPLSVKEKVFVIGLSKTGTTSLAKALDLIGFQCSHYPLGAMNYYDPHPFFTRFMNYLGYKLFNNPIGIRNYRLKSPCIDLTQFNEFDAFADTPIAYCYKELDKIHPNSKFILTTRELEPWLKSCSWHMGNPYRPGRPKWWNELEMGKWTAMSTNMINRLNYDLYGSAVFDESIFRKAFERHIKDVREYFRGREGDLLVLDISAGEGWDRLCTFLHKPVPPIPFPMENISARSK